MAAVEKERDKAKTAAMLNRAGSPVCSRKEGATDKQQQQRGNGSDLNLEIIPRVGILYLYLVGIVKDGAALSNCSIVIDFVQTMIAF